MKKHAKELEVLTQGLLKYETLDKAQIDDLLAGKTVVAKRALKTEKSDKSAPKTKTKKTSTVKKTGKKV